MSVVKVIKVTIVAKQNCQKQYYNQIQLIKISNLPISNYPIKVYRNNLQCPNSIDRDYCIANIGQTTEPFGKIIIPVALNNFFLFSEIYSNF